MQFIVNPAKLPPALQLICREAEARQHDHENEAIPDLQTPFDGFEYFHRFALTPALSHPMGEGELFPAARTNENRRWQIACEMN